MWANKEYYAILKPCQRQMVKIEAFGFESEGAFVYDILKSHLLFSELSEEQLRQLSDPRYITSVVRNKSLFTTGQICDGIYVLIEGMIKEQFTDEVYKTHYLGSLLGIASVVSKSEKYDSTARCESACRLVFIPRDNCMQLFSSYERFELNACLFYLHHHLNFMKQHLDLLEVG